MNFDLSEIPIEEHAIQFGGALAILIIGWIVARMVAGAVSRATARSGRVSPTLLPLLNKAIRFALLAIVIMAFLDKIGVDTSGFFAMIGAAGLAVGLALKDTVADVAAGVTLLILRPFDVGEGVDIGGTAGVVAEIGIFQTHLTTFDGIPVVLNNSAVRTSKITNFARATTRRTDLEIGIGYADDIEKAKAAMLDVVKSDGRVLADPEPMVKVTSLGDSSVNLLVRYQTQAADFFTTKLEMTQALKERMDKEGISIPFPQRDLHVIKDDAAA